MEGKRWCGVPPHTEEEGEMCFPGEQKKLEPSAHFMETSQESANRGVAKRRMAHRDNLFEAPLISVGVTFLSLSDKLLGSQLLQKHCMELSACQ